MNPGEVSEENLEVFRNLAVFAYNRFKRQSAPSNAYQTALAKVFSDLEKMKASSSLSIILSEQWALIEKLNSASPETGEAIYDSTTFKGLITCMLDDGGHNWGRLALAYYIAGHLFQQTSIDSDETQAFVTQDASRILAQAFGPWVQKNGGWKGFLAQFGSTREHPWTVVRNWLPVILAAGFVVGTGAMLLRLVSQTKH
jgi:hypothetical protein